MEKTNFAYSKEELLKQIDKYFIIFDNISNITDEFGNIPENCNQYVAFLIKDGSFYEFSNHPFLNQKNNKYFGCTKDSVKDIEKYDNFGKRTYSKDLNEECIKYLIDKL